MNTKEELKSYLSKITPLDETAMNIATKKQAMLFKPPGSLGRLEDISIQVAGITRKGDVSLKKGCVITFSADNGVVDEGVSITPQDVTISQSINLSTGKSGAATISKHFGNEHIVCDVGIKGDVTEGNIINRKIAYGTNNIVNGPAMTREQAERAILTGIEMVKVAIDKGCDMIGIGEMGIGNTTTSSAVLSVLTGIEVEKVTGKGGGLLPEAYINKINVIKKAIEINNPNKEDAIDVLSKVGGYDLAAMAGAFIGAAYYHIPAVIDGFISVVAALSAARICPLCASYMVPSHASYEIGYEAAINELGLKPIFLLEMRLGEGSGCPFTFEVIKASCAVLNEMVTFNESSVNDSYLDEIRDDEEKGFKV